MWFSCYGVDLVWILEIFFRLNVFKPVLSADFISKTPGCYMIRIGCFSSIFQRSCKQSRLKNHRDQQCTEACLFRQLRSMLHGQKNISFKLLIENPISTITFSSNSAHKFIVDGNAKFMEFQISLQIQFDPFPIAGESSRGRNIILRL